MREVLIPGRLQSRSRRPSSSTRRSGKRSGHWQHYRQNMFLVEVESEEMGMKAMNCPGHFLMYASAHAAIATCHVRFHEQTPPAPQRSVRRADRADPRPAVRSGRRALLRHASTQIGDEVERVLRTRPARVRRLRAQFRHASCRRGPRIRSARIATWDRAERRLKPRARDASAIPTSSTRVTALSTGRRSTST